MDYSQFSDEEIFDALTKLTNNDMMLLVYHPATPIRSNPDYERIKNVAYQISAIRNMQPSDFITS